MLEEIPRATLNDPELQVVISMVKEGQWNKLDSSLSLYRNEHEELTQFLNVKLYVKTEFRLSSQRACIVVSSVWPGIDKQVEQIVKECIPCQPAIHQSPDYTVCCKDRNGFGGGVVLYIRDNMLNSQRNDLAIDDLELACIEVKLPYNKSFLVATWYRPPSSQIDLFHE